MVPITESEKLKKTSQKALIKIFCFNNSGTRKTKDFQKHWWIFMEVHVTLQFDSTKHKLFQFISWSNFIERFQNLSPGIGGKVLID